MSKVKIGNDWDSHIGEEFDKEYYLSLREFLKWEYSTQTIYPDMYDIFNALKYTAYGETKVVILGQDPYINPGEAHGLCFSVKPPSKIPPSLMNIFVELQNDIGCPIAPTGCLTNWAKQGVLLLNTVLTVRAKQSNSHKNKGWEIFTTRILEVLNQKDAPVVFMLWGNHAKSQSSILTNPQHLILTAAHPSPLAGGKFFGCKHFSKANEFLSSNGLSGIDWCNLSESTQF